MTAKAPGAVLAALSGQDKVVVIRRPFVDWLGSIEAALLLDQCLYEADRAGGDWFKVTDTQWRDRLLLAQHKLIAARKSLVGLKLLETARRGVPARLYYRMDVEAVFDAFALHLGAQQLVVAPRTTGNARVQNKRRACAEHSIFQEAVKDLEEKRLPVDSPAESTRPAPASPSDHAGHAPQATGPTDPQAADLWGWLAENVAHAVTGRRDAAYARGGRRRGWVGAIVGDLGKLAADDPILASEVWEAFTDSLPEDQRARYLTDRYARDALGRWSVNGGARTVARIAGRMA